MDERERANLEWPMRSDKKEQCVSFWLTVDDQSKARRTVYRLSELDHIRPLSYSGWLALRCRSSSSREVR